MRLLLIFEDGSLAVTDNLDQDLLTSAEGGYVQIVDMANGTELLVGSSNLWKKIETAQ